MATIATTHTGSLPKPPVIANKLIARDRGDSVDGLDDDVSAAVAEAVATQASIGLDLINDGEVGKISYSMYVKDRLTGFDGESEAVQQARPELEDHPDFETHWKTARGSGFFAPITTPACTSDIGYRGVEQVRSDLTTLLAASVQCGVPKERLFMTSASPGVISLAFVDHFYNNREAYLAAIADAMRAEYRAILDAGITLQIDCPDLARSRHLQFARMSLDKFRQQARLQIDALNHAIAGLPPDRIRMHVCWGNYEGPHNHDVELQDIVDILLLAKPLGLSIEASNPRHAHEWEVWRDRKLPPGKYLIPGVVDTTNNYIEHPKLVQQRIMNYANVVGASAVVAGTDCGFGSNVVANAVAPSIAWAKLRSLVDGARLADSALAGARAS
jgi:5-methyltetrahydropteroyltriglutamate--homocysteine methyltransferase